MAASGSRAAILAAGSLRRRIIAHKERRRASATNGASKWLNARRQISATHNMTTSELANYATAHEKSCAPELYYIQSLERGAWGNDAVWWRPESKGYTSHIDEAGKYTAEECAEIDQNENRFLPVPFVDAITHRAVDFSKAVQLEGLLE
jgi:hypothetical protein